MNAVLNRVFVWKWKNIFAWTKIFLHFRRSRTYAWNELYRKTGVNVNQAFCFLSLWEREREREHERERKFSLDSDACVRMVQAIIPIFFCSLGYTTMINKGYGPILRICNFLWEDICLPHNKLKSDCSEFFFIGLY